MILATYAPFEQMHGRKSRLEELILLLQHFSRGSVLYVCSVTGIILKLWERDGGKLANYDVAIENAFEFIRADWYKLAARLKEPELVFHRRQLLFLMKLAIEHCPHRGHDLLKVRPGPFGTMLLMANDHFHYGLHPSLGTDELVDKISRVAAEFVPVNEYSGFRPVNKLTRAHVMMTKYTEDLHGHPDFVDVGNEYERLTEISLLDYEALAFGLFTRCSEQINLQTLRADGSTAAVRPENFSKTAIPRPIINAFFAEFSATPRELRTSIRFSREGKRDFGANDFTIFRNKPLIAETYGTLVSDINFVIEKFESGPYWRISNIDKKTGDRLRRFWGAVFEAYVNDLLKATAAKVGARFIPDPRLFTNRNVQVCDGLLIEGSSLVILEYKASMFTAAAKYSGDHLLLCREIERKLVRDSAERKKKGVEQLSEAIHLLFSAHGHSVIEGLDTSQIRNVYPLLITLDDIGASVLVSRVLNTFFRPDRSKTNGVDVRPLFCTDIESLETILPHIANIPLSGFLQHWLDKDPALNATLLARVPQGLTEKHSEYLYQHWRSLTSSIGSRLFPDECRIQTSAADATEN